jgi:RNA polymerase sigma-70 factor (ECF subfamily)
MGSDGERQAEGGDLAAAIQRGLVAARRAWPDFSLDSPALETFARARLDPRDPVAAAAQLHWADLAIACVSLGGARAALEMLDRRYLHPLVTELRRTPRHAAHVDEAAQHLRERLWVAQDGRPARLSEYAGRGPLAGWLRVALLREVSNARRSAAPRGTPLHPDVSVGAAVSPELQVLRARDQAVLEGALRQAVAALTAEERTLLRLHFIDGLGLDRLSRLFQIHRATAARRLAVARKRLREETVARIKLDLRLDTVELESWIGLVRSHLGLSVGALIGGAGAPVD